VAFTHDIKQKEIIMSTNAEEVRKDMRALVEDTRALLRATAGVTEERIAATRQRLAYALEKGKAVYATAKEKTVEKAKAADQAIQAHPYRSMGVAFGLGALLSYFLARRR
jgi:ElaB/YqjD/DUF883 family membrane-anchored ribosome-binding protein